MYASFRMLAGVALDVEEEGCVDEEGKGDDSAAVSLAAAAGAGDEEAAESWASDSFSAASSFSKFRRSQRRVHSSPSVPFSTQTMHHQ